MTRAILYPVATLLLLSLAGCASSAPSPNERPLLDNQAAVFVDGRWKAYTPSNVHIRRNFGDTIITLRQGNKVVRTFEVELTTSSNTATLSHSYSMTNAEGVRGFNVEDLPRGSNDVYIIPYYPYSIEIRDHTYGLTLIVRD